jgi:molybdate transport system ATP-binding protein
MLSVAIAHRFAEGGFALDVAFEVPATGVTALFGPSGCGKSTILSAVAGLMRPQAGRIRRAGEALFDAAAGVFVPPERRRCGVVFQDARLFPHLSVGANLRYGWKRCSAGGRAGCPAASASAWPSAAPCWRGRCCC